MSNKVSVLSSTKKNYPWYVAYPDGDKRKKKYFKKKERAGGADEWAALKRQSLAEVGNRHASVTDSEFNAVIKFRNAVSILPENAMGRSLNDAVEYYLQHLRVRDKAITCIQAADKLILSIQKEGRGKRHLDDVTSRLKRFTDIYHDWLTCEISTEVINEFLDDLNLAPQSVLHYRSKLNQLFLYALKIGACDVNPVTDAIKPSARGAEIGILKPIDLSKLLSAADETAQAGIAISFFAGLRRSELEKLDWSEIDLEDGHIEIKAVNAKTAQRRIVAISDNLKAWLLPLEKHEGNVCISHSRFRTSLEKAQKSAGITCWPHNAGRHSFASYHVAHHKNAPLTALEMGHSNTKLLFQRYRQLVNKKAASSYWNIIPATDTEITYISAAR